jgi:hypothetical protein
LAAPTTLFQRHIGIDYSGAGAPESRLPGIRVFESSPLLPPHEVRFGHHWSRRELAQWLSHEINSQGPAIIGIDHGFSFPLAYMEKYNLGPTWGDLLIDFTTHWPTAALGARVSDIRKGSGAARLGSPRWKRLCEYRSGSAKSVFHFGVPGSVAHSTHAGIPWLHNFRTLFASSIHFWPFDNWAPRPGVSVIAEIYPSLWKSRYPRPDLTGDQLDAFATSSWLRDADISGELSAAFHPNLTSHERVQAGLEGWILGVY